MFDAIGEGHKLMQRSVSHDEALRQAYAADPMQAVIDLHELAREANELEDRVRKLEGEKQRLIVRVDNFAAYLETFCKKFAEDGHCPIFYRCPAPALGKSCGDMKKADWFWDFEQDFKEGKL